MRFIHNYMFDVKCNLLLMNGANDFTSLREPLFSVNWGMGVCITKRASNALGVVVAMGRKGYRK